MSFAPLFGSLGESYVNSLREGVSGYTAIGFENMIFSCSMAVYMNSRRSVVSLYNEYYYSNRASCKNRFANVTRSSFTTVCPACLVYHCEWHPRTVLVAGASPTTQLTASQSVSASGFSFLSDTPPPSNGVSQRD